MYQQRRQLFHHEHMPLHLHWVLCQCHKLKRESFHQYMQDQKDMPHMPSLHYLHIGQRHRVMEKLTHLHKHYQRYKKHSTDYLMQ